MRSQFLRVAEAGERETGPAHDGHRRKTVIVVLPVAKIRVRNRAGAKIGFALVQHHKLLGMRIGNGMEQHGVDHREERSVRANSQGEREDRDGGEPGALAQRANREAQILQKFVESAAAPLIAGDVTDQRDVAEFSTRRLRRLLGRFAAILAILLRHFQMRSEFFFEFVLFVGSFRLIAAPTAAMKRRFHASLSFLAGSSTPAIASVSCAHFERSERSRFLPAAVSL